MSAAAPVIKAPQSASCHAVDARVTVDARPSVDARVTVDARTIDALDAAICRIARRLHAETYRMLVLVREFDDRFRFAKWSFKSCAEWLAWRCQISLSAAREQVRTAQALRQLPAISAAFAQGRISYTKVRALTRVAGERDEDLLLAYALKATSAQVEERCRQRRNVFPDAGDIARRAWEQRSVTISRNPERGTVLITVELPAADGELIARALDKAVDSGEVALGRDHVGAHGEERTASDSWRAQQADALVCLARAYLAGGVAGRAEEAEMTGGAPAPAVADHYQLIVHVDEQSLHGGAGKSDLPLETIKRLGCDGNLIALIEDGQGRPLALGRKHRVVSPALKKALFARDGGCTFPGCHRKHYVDAHHLLHEGGFAIRRGQNGVLEYLRADGRSIPRSGYRLDDMTDDMHDDSDDNTTCNIDAHPSIEGSCTNVVRENTVREDAATYRLSRAYSRARERPRRYWRPARDSACESRSRSDAEPRA